MLKGNMVSEIIRNEHVQYGQVYPEIFLMKGGKLNATSILLGRRICLMYEVWIIATLNVSISGRWGD
jgi:hypothetical protein